ncbi:MAG: hypothetical protein AB1414_14470 [bacterium]
MKCNKGKEENMEKWREADSKIDVRRIELEKDEYFSNFPFSPFLLTYTSFRWLKCYKRLINNERPEMHKKRKFLSLVNRF